MNAIYINFKNWCFHYKIMKQTFEIIATKADITVKNGFKIEVYLN